MIAHNPFGVGIGQFEFGALPWMVDLGVAKFTEIHKSPHSEPLRLIVENGWLYGALIAALTYLVARRLRFKRARVMLPFLAAFAIQAAFQFPLEVPASVLLCAFGFAALLSPSRDSYTKTNRIAVSILATIALVFSFIHTWASLPSRDRSPEQAKLVCKLDPYNWISCLYAARRLEELQLVEDARDAYVRQMELRPRNFAILFEWAMLEMRAGNHEDSCDFGPRAFVHFQTGDFSHPFCSGPRSERAVLLESYSRWLEDRLKRAKERPR
jgi:hypothetical protein